MNLVLLQQLYQAVIRRHIDLQDLPVLLKPLFHHQLQQMHQQQFQLVVHQVILRLHRLLIQVIYQQTYQHLFQHLIHQYHLPEDPVLVHQVDLQDFLVFIHH